MKFRNGIVRYRYRTGLKKSEIERAYQEEIFKERWHGPYQADMKDFQKFFAEITRENPLGSGEVREILLITEKGVYHWYQRKGWVYLGK